MCGEAPTRGAPPGDTAAPPVGHTPPGFGVRCPSGEGGKQQRGHRSTTAAFAARGEETRTRGRAHTRTALRPGPRGGCRRGGPAPVPVEEAARCGAARRGGHSPGGGGGAGPGGGGAVRCGGAGPRRRRRRRGAGRGGSAPGRALPALRAPPAAPGAAPNGAARRGTGGMGRHGTERLGVERRGGARGCGLRAGVRADRNPLRAHRQRAPSACAAGARAVMCPRCTHSPSAHPPASMDARWLCPHGGGTLQGAHLFTTRVAHTPPDARSGMHAHLLWHAHTVCSCRQHRAQCWGPCSWHRELLWCWGNEAVRAAEALLLGKDQQGAAL